MRARRRWGTVAWGLVALLAAEGPCCAQDPFAPGLRWSHTEAQTTTWLPRDVAFAGGGEIALVGVSGTAPGMALFGGQWEADTAGVTTPALDSAGLAFEGSGVLEVEASTTDGLFALEEPAVGPRRVARRSALDLSTESWPLILPQRGPGSGRMELSRDGSLLVVAELDAGSQRVHVTWIDTALGVVLAERELSGASLRALEVSAGGERVLVQRDATISVFDGQGLPVHEETAPSVPTAVALSGDGASFAFSTFGAVERRGFDGVHAYGALGSVAGPSDEVATELALDHTGSVLASGWWRFTDGRAVRLVTHTLAGGGAVETVHAVQDDPASLLQNRPSALELDPSGTLVAFGLWGVGDQQPEVLLFDRAEPQPLLAMDLPGSVFALDLDPTAERVVVGHKATHANQLSGKGAVALGASGRADWVAQRTPKVLQDTAFHFRSSGAQLAFALAGIPSDPQMLFGVSGLLQLEPQVPLAVLPMQPDGMDRFRLDVQPKPGTFGLTVGLQGLGWSVTTGWSLGEVRAEALVF